MSSYEDFKDFVEISDDNVVLIGDPSGEPVDVFVGESDDRADFRSVLREALIDRYGYYKRYFVSIPGDELDIRFVGPVRLHGDAGDLFSPMFDTDTSFRFDDSLSMLDTADVTGMREMFRRSVLPDNCDLSGFDTSKVTDMSMMFFEADVKSIDVSSFDTSNVENMSQMFSDCDELKSVDISGFDFSKTKSVFEMFDGCYNLESIGTKSVDLSNVEQASRIFAGCNNLQDLDLDGFGSEAVFVNWDYENDVVSIGDPSGKTVEFDAQVLRVALDRTDYSDDDEDPMMVYGFYEGCVDVKFVSPVVLHGDASGLFEYYYPASHCVQHFRLDDSLRMLDTSDVHAMSRMFSGAVFPEDVNPYFMDTSNVEDMSRMFCHCAVKNLDLSCFDTSKVKDMTCMFAWSDIESVDVSSFDTSNVTRMRHMFYDCDSLKALDNMLLRTKSDSVLSVRVAGDVDALQSILDGVRSQRSVQVSWESDDRYKAGSMTMTVDRFNELREIAPVKSRQEEITEDLLFPTEEGFSNTVSKSLSQDGRSFDM